MQTHKILLIGWDTADWKVITPLLDEGEMPNLEKILNTGLMGNLATLHSDLSPMLWTSSFTIPWDISCEETWPGRPSKPGPRMWPPHSPQAPGTC